jgi:hypothetical protein
MALDSGKGKPSVCLPYTSKSPMERVGKTLKIHPTQRTPEKVHHSKSVRIDEKVHHTGI